MPPVMERLAPVDGGHNLFLETCFLWIDITAPLYWWKQIDRYRAPADGDEGFLPTATTQQSESTMHTLMARPLTQEDFERPIWPGTLARLNESIAARDFESANNELPGGFLQARMKVTNYKSLRNIIAQRRTHRLGAWRLFIREIYAQCQHPEFLRDLAADVKLKAT